MSARVDWRPTSNDWTSTSGQSRAKQALEIAFGHFPERLSVDDLPILRGMEAVEQDGPWRSLIDAIEKHGSIELRMVY